MDGANKPMANKRELATYNFFTSTRLMGGERE